MPAVISLLNQQIHFKGSAIFMQILRDLSQVHKPAELTYRISGSQLKAGLS